MRYSELLLKLYDVSLKLKKQNDQNYKPSNLFLELGNLLYLENTCDLYYSRINELNNSEMQIFKSLASEDGRARRKFIEDYKKMYDSGKLNSVFLRDYKNISDYIAVVFITELGDLLLNADFTKLFNNNIRSVYAESPDILSCFRIFSFNYMNLGVKNENIGKTFKNLLKEFEILSKTGKVNGFSGVKLYDFCNKMLMANNKVLDIVNRSMNIKEKPDNMINLSDIFLKVENSDNYFSDKYMPLFVDITSRNSFLESIVQDKEIKNALVIALFLVKLKDEDFLKSITTEDNHLNLDKACKIISTLKSKGALKEPLYYSPHEFSNYYKIVNDTFEESKKWTEKHKKMN